MAHGRATSNEHTFDYASTMGTRRRESYVRVFISGDGVRRHVWIIGRPEGPLRDPWPGLLVEWERRADGWWARVVYVPYPAELGEVAERWIAAEHIRPAPEP
jgi:hypothetical protein